MGLNFSAKSSYSAFLMDYLQRNTVELVQGGVLFVFLLTTS